MGWSGGWGVVWNTVNHHSGPLYQGALLPLRCSGELQVADLVGLGRLGLGFPNL